MCRQTICLEATDASSDALPPHKTETPESTTTVPESREPLELPPLPALPSTWAAQFEVVPEMPIIGTGAFGTIFQVRDRRTHQLFAVKVMQRAHFEIRGIGNQLTMEVQGMLRASAVSEPGYSRIVHLYAATEEVGCVFLLLELCFQGNLLHQLAASPLGLPETTAKRAMRHLFQALRDIHSADIIHRDIKLENLLITTNGVLKVTDFGWASEAKEAPTSLAGTFETMAPEVLQGKPQTIATDVWSAGAVLFNIICGRPLLQQSSEPGSIQQHYLNEIGIHCPLKAHLRPLNVSESCWELLQMLLEVDVARRPTAEQALNHPWLQAEASPLQEAAASTQDVVATAPAKDVVAASHEKRNDPDHVGGGDASICGA